MKNMKKGLAFALVLVMALMTLTTGCAPKAAAPAEPAAPAGEQVTVDVFQFKVEIAKELEAAAKAYEAKNPNVKINVQTVGGGGDYGAALRAQFQSGAEPDIYNVGGPQDIADWTAKLEDLSDQPWVAQAMDGILSGATVDGKVYALPFNIEGYGLVYNKGIFEAAGVDTASVKDFATLETAVKALDAKIKSGALKEKYPQLEAVFEYAAKETWVTGLHTSNAALSQEFDNSLTAFSAKKVEFKNADALKQLIDLMADYSPSGKDRAKLNAVDYATQVDNGLAIERVAVVQQGNWIYSGVAKIDQAVADNLGILPLPVPGGKSGSIPVGVPMHWAVNKDAPDADKQAAKDFLNWLYTSDEGKDYVVNKFFFIPPLKGYEGFDPKDSLGKAVKGYAEAGNTMPWVFMGYPTGWGQEILGTDIQKYLAGEMKWEELVKDVQTKWEEARK